MAMETPPPTATEVPYLGSSGSSGVGQRVHFEAYGCQMNTNDTEIVAALMEQAGYTRTESPDDADVVFLVTCAVRDNAEKRIWARLDTLAAAKVGPSPVSVVRQPRVWLRDGRLSNRGGGVGCGGCTASRAAAHAHRRPGLHGGAPQDPAPRGRQDGRRRVRPGRRTFAPKHPRVLDHTAHLQPPSASSLCDSIATCRGCWPRSMTVGSPA